jgi:hypothetical protein
MQAQGPEEDVKNRTKPCVTRAGTPPSKRQERHQRQNGRNQFARGTEESNDRHGTHHGAAGPRALCATHPRDHAVWATPGPFVDLDPERLPGVGGQVAPHVLPHACRPGRRAAGPRHPATAQPSTADATEVPEVPEVPGGGLHMLVVRGRPRPVAPAHNVLVLFAVLVFRAAHPGVHCTGRADARAGRGGGDGSGHLGIGLRCRPSRSQRLVRLEQRVDPSIEVVADG